MKILMICPQFKPIVGGYERAAERLSVALVAKGHVVTVISERRDSSWQAKEEYDGVQIRRQWCLYRPRLHILTSIVTFSFFLLTQGRRFQVWHIHQYGMHAMLGVALGKLLHRPVVLKMMSSGGRGIENVTSELPLSCLIKFLLRKVNSVVAVSSETLAEAVAFGIPVSRVHILGNGIDTHTFEPCSREECTGYRKKIGIEATGVVVFVGRLAEPKNLHGLLNAWKMALANLSEGWKLVLVGDGPMREQLKTFSEAEGLSTSVRFAGQQSNVEEWMASADILVLSSHWEGLSNTMLEAMATGLPVVSTRVSGSTETLEETGAGLVVDVGEMEQLAKALVRLASDPALRRQMGKIGRAVIESRYSIEYVASMHEGLYRKIIN